MKISRIDQAIDTCHGHLESTHSFGTEIESYLTRCLVVLMCSTFEEEVKHLIDDRTSAIEDEPLRTFFAECVNAVLRGLKTGDIGDFFKKFGPQYKQSFRDKLKDKERAETFFNNIVTSRHGIAHTTNLNTTFQELVVFYEESHIILDAFKQTLKETLPYGTK